MALGSELRRVEAAHDQRRLDHRQEISELRQRADAAARDARAKLAARDREIAALKKARGNIKPKLKIAKTPAAAGRVEPAAPAAVFLGPWTLKKGETLCEVLERWTDTASVELVYVTNRRYTLYGPWRTTGTLEEAVPRLMSALSYLPSPPVATFAQEGRSLVLQHRLRKEAARPAA